MESKTKMNKKGVFGLTSVQAFFAILLAVALLAYIIIIISGILSTTSLGTTVSGTGYAASETCWINGTTYTVAQATLSSFSLVSAAIINTTSGAIIPAGNYSVSSAGVITNLTLSRFDKAAINYTYTFDRALVNANSIFANTSGGISTFFAAINPVYAILAILVIILVLVVLVRVVTGGQVTRTEDSAGVI